MMKFMMQKMMPMMSGTMEKMDFAEKDKMMIPIRFILKKFKLLEY